jgi:hypothetical protein
MISIGLNIARLIVSKKKPALQGLPATAVAYSMRRLLDDYSGKCVNVRRSLDNASTDIGFAYNPATLEHEIDSIALANFVGYENLLSFSEEFDNAAWTNTESTTITPNSTLAPNGTLTADTMTPDAADALHRLSQVTTGGVISGVPYTFSIYVKPNGYDWLFVRSAVTGTFQNANFNLSTGAVGYVSAGLTASITSATNGFYRIVVTGTTPSTSNISFFFRSAPTEQANDSVNTFTGNGTSGAFIWGAQINQGATAQTYSPTSRRNLLTFSEEFDNAAWPRVSVTVTPNTAIAPNGEMTADTIVGSVGTAAKYISQYFTSISGKSYTYSMYAKQDTGRYLQLTPVGGGIFPVTVQTFVNFDLQTGAVSSAGTDFVPDDYSITDEGNGWYRISLRATASSSSAVARFLVISLGTGLETRLPTITGTPSYIVSGAQTELGATATEYQLVNEAWAATRDGNGFVTTWYDQSGNGRNAVQATAAEQPAIVTGGVVNSEGGKPAIVFDGVDDSLAVTSFGLIPQPFTRNYIGVKKSNTGVSHWINSVTGSPNTADYDNSSTTHAIFAGSTIAVPLADNERAVFTSLYNGASSSLVKNGASTTSNAGTGGYAGVRICSLSGASNFSNVAMQELNIFNSLLTATDHQLLERNQGEFFEIEVA